MPNAVLTLRKSNLQGFSPTVKALPDTDAVIGNNALMSAVPTGVKPTAGENEVHCQLPEPSDTNVAQSPGFIAKFANPGKITLVAL